MSRPRLFSGLGSVFAEAFGDGQTATFSLNGALVRTAPCIFRENRGSGFADVDGANVEADGPRLAIPSEEAIGISAGMTVEIVGEDGAVVATFTVSGLTHDGRAMHRVGLEEVDA